MLDDFYFGDPRLILVPIEHLSPRGVGADFARRLAERRHNGAAVAAMIDEAFPRYWQRSADLARRSRQWPAPRLRNIAVIDTETAIPPYVQLLNTSTWTLFDCDFDPESGDAELLAYLLAQGDRMAVTGEVTMAALHNAAWWFERSADEIATFAAATRASRRPDAAAYAALADAIGWMSRLEHESLRPPRSPAGLLPIAGTGYFAPPDVRDEAARSPLVQTWTEVGRGAIDRYRARHRKAEQSATRDLLEWLSDGAPEVLITGRNNKVLWDCAEPTRVTAVRNELKRAGGETTRSIHRDLEILDDHSRRFRAIATDFDELQAGGEEVAQDGFTYLYVGRLTLAYNLYEPHLDRLSAPALPFAAAMLGARAYHEWCHLAVDAGWVCTSVSADERDLRLDGVRRILDEAVAAAPPAARHLAAADLRELLALQRPGSLFDWGGESISVAGDTIGAALLRMLLPRIADYKANLIAVCLQNVDEREAYVRQNIRTLRAEFAAPQLWRALARYAYEAQYLRFSEVPNRREYFLRSTGFASDFLDSGILTEDLFDRLDRATAHLLDMFTVDASKLTPPAPGGPTNERGSTQ